MARRRSTTLTEAELRLMDVLWQKGEATVGDVTAVGIEQTAVAQMIRVAGRGLARELVARLAYTRQQHRLRRLA